jgi:hypothetical protein
MKLEMSKPTQQRKADQFLWYWQPPFNDPKSHHHFDREHWWKETPRDVSHDASLYELLRRHPKMGELQCERLRFSQEPYPTTHPFASDLVLTGPKPLIVKLENESLNHVAWQMLFYSLRSWPKLSTEDRAKFQNSLKASYPGKGRDLTKGVFDLTEAARAWAKSEEDVGGPSFEECIGDLAKGYSTDERLILAVDTDFGSKKEAKAALKQISDIFWKRWRKPKRQVRAHELDWLKAIQDFEREFDLMGYEQFKLGYPKTFKKFIAHFESDQARGLRAWWRRQGRSQWADDAR